MLHINWNMSFPVLCLWLVTTCIIPLCMDVVLVAVNS